MWPLEELDELRQEPAEFAPSAPVQQQIGSLDLIELIK